MTDEQLQREIIRRLDQLVVLYKLTNRAVIGEAWDQINKDEVARAVLDLADGSLDVGELQRRVSEVTGKANRTIQTRIGDLVRQGVLAPDRQGKRLFYMKTDLFG